MKTASLMLLYVAGAWAQTASQNALVESSQKVYSIAKNDILKSAEQAPETLWSFKPVPEVRTFGEIVAHVADGQYEFCGPAKGESVNKDVEKTAKTKAAVVTALKESFAYCDAAYSKMTAATAAQMVTSFGGQMTRLGVMDFNTAHTMEHYGNLVTYMRLKGIVPPSSQK